MSKLLLGYLAGQAAAILALPFLPLDTLSHALWQTGVGCISAIVALAGVRHFKPPGALVWYLFSAGLFLNAFGVTIEWFDQTPARPQVADVFWLALYPFLIVGLATLVYWRIASEDKAMVVLNTAASVVSTVFLGIFAWQFLVWQAPSDRMNLAARVVVIAYPLGDLMVIPLILRLFMTGAARIPALALLSGSYCALLAGDLAWASFTRSGVHPTPPQQRIIETVSMIGFALLGAAGLHPSVREVVPKPHTETGPRRINWPALALSVLVPPTILLLQVLLDFVFSKLLRM
jgi:hypothetical protein